jgi:hypothetical protein
MLRTTPIRAAALRGTNTSPSIHEPVCEPSRLAMGFPQSRVCCTCFVACEHIDLDTTETFAFEAQYQSANRLQTL